VQGRGAQAAQHVQGTGSQSGQILLFNYPKEKA